MSSGSGPQPTGADFAQEPLLATSLNPQHHGMPAYQPLGANTLGSDSESSSASSLSLGKRKAPPSSLGTDAEDAVTPLAQGNSQDPYAQWVSEVSSKRRPSEVLSESSSRGFGQLSIHGHQRNESALTLSDDSRRSSSSSAYSAGFGSPGSAVEFTGWAQQPSASAPYTSSIAQEISSLEGPHSAPILPVTNSAPLKQPISRCMQHPATTPAYNTYAFSSAAHPMNHSHHMYGASSRPLSVNTSRPSTAVSHQSPASLSQSPQTTSSAQFSTTETTPPESARDNEHSRAIFGGDDSLKSAELAPPSAVSNTSDGRKDSPYARSPEMRISHKMAERKRRKEMKDLFDELRDSLPVERGMKASKWETLTAAVSHEVLFQCRSCV